MSFSDPVWSDIWLKEQLDKLPDVYFSLDDVEAGNVEMPGNWSVLKVSFAIKFRQPAKNENHDANVIFFSVL